MNVANPLDGVWGNRTPTGERPIGAVPTSYPPILVGERCGAAVCGVSVRTFHKLRKEPWFPAAIELGPRCLRWSRDELTAAMLERAPRRVVQAEPLQLQAARKTRQKEAA